MEISARLRILGSIQTGSVYYFEEEQLTSEEPHYFIVLNRSPRTEDFLMLVCASSKIEKRVAIAERLGFPKETLVFLTPLECKLFSKDTVIDCNSVFEKTAQSIIEKLEQKKLKVCTESLPEDVVLKLIAGVLASPQISEKVKRMLREGAQVQ